MIANALGSRGLGGMVGSFEFRTAGHQRQPSKLFLIMSARPPSGHHFGGVLAMHVHLSVALRETLGA